MFKKDTHSPWLDLAVFAVIVGFFLFSAVRLLEKNRAQVPAPKIDRSESAVPSPVRDERTPASAKKDDVAEVELPCLPAETYKHNTGAEFLRISGGACSRKFKVTAGHGRNLTNGSEILCFVDKDRDRVSTNYFQLAPGVNRVELNLVWSNGTKRRSFLEILKN